MSEQLFGEAMREACVRAPFALAVSGGADSVALMCLAADWAKAQGGPAPLVLTVDHGLRAGAAKEAGQVKKWAQALGLAHHTLKWSGAKPGSNIQAAARAARYELMGAFCARHGLTHLLTAHTQEDQAETFLLRLARGSGVEGLAGMQVLAPLPVVGPVAGPVVGPVAGFDGVQLFRPLLGTQRAALRHYLQERSHEWVEDPSNDDAAYARVRMRALMPLLATEGLTAARLSQAAAHMSDARLVLRAAADKLAEACLAYDPAGFARLNRGLLCGASPSIALRLLGRALMHVGGGTYAPRRASLERLWAALNQDQFTGCTLAGCRILPDGSGDDAEKVLIVREWRALAARQRAHNPLCLVPGQAEIWDNRFDVRLGRTGMSGGWQGEIRPLGRQGWHQLCALMEQNGLSDPKALAIPAPVRASLPGLWRGDHLAAAPHFGVKDPHQFPEKGSASLAIEVRFRKTESWLSC